MEWDRVKTILIMLLIVCNLILGGNIFFQLQGRSQAERRGLAYAEQLLEREGAVIPENAFSDLPVKLYAYTARRDSGAEAGVAQSLLGQQPTVTSPGGGVVIYSASTGKVSFRSGGIFECELNRAVPQGADQAAFFQGLLEEAGLDMEKTQVQEEGGMVSFALRYRGDGEIVNAQALCRGDDKGLAITGKWPFTQDFVRGEQACSRAELALALRQLILDQGESLRIQGVRTAFLLESSPSMSLQLTPVWVVETDSGELLLNALTKKIVVP